jgi:hypothetical protein
VVKEFREALPPIVFFLVGFNLVELTTQLFLADYMARLANSFLTEFPSSTRPRERPGPFSAAMLITSGKRISARNQRGRGGANSCRRAVSSGVVAWAAVSSQRSSARTLGPAQRP